VFGHAVEQHVRRLRYQGLMDFAELWTAPAAENQGRSYATSWLLVHHLFNHHRARVDTFPASLSLGGNARELWTQTFPALTDGSRGPDRKSSRSG
jgi:hypothetical protein